MKISQTMARSREEQVMCKPAACNIGPPPVFSHSFEKTSDEIVINYVMMR